MKREPKFKVGDRVKVMRASTDEEHDLWMDSWVPEMSKTVGKVLTIEYVYGDDYQEENEYCKYALAESGYAYPEFVLQNDMRVGQQLLFNFMD